VSRRQRAWNSAWNLRRKLTTVGRNNLIAHEEDGEIEIRPMFELEDFGDSKAVLRVATT
jgi:hypothetical protein